MGEERSILELKNSFFSVIVVRRGFLFAFGPLAGCVILLLHPCNHLDNLENSYRFI